MLTHESMDRSAALERLSALADGELDATEVAQACAQWREAGELRASWHAYQLIGDVLRSEDLAADPVREASFFGALRTRLAAEPVVIAPRAVAVPEPPGASVHSKPGTGPAAQGARPRRSGWWAPSAIAAGFVVVAGVVMLSRAPTLGPAPAPTLASADAQRSRVDPAARLASTPPPALTRATANVEPSNLVTNGKLIRDARLDRYLAAHKQFAGSSALGVPSPFLRSVTVDVSGR